MNFCGIIALLNPLALNHLRPQKIRTQNEFLRTQKIPRFIAELLRTKLLEN